MLIQEQIDQLIGEVDTEDVYLMRDKQDVVSINDPNHIHVKGHKRAFDFEPNVIFDLGANVGVFTTYAHKLFPKAKIISVEPDQDNFKQLSERTIGLNYSGALINKPVGKGIARRAKGAPNGTGECYLSESIGYTIDQLNEGDVFYEDNYHCVSFDRLCDKFCLSTDKIVVKMDIEGAEISVFSDEESMKCLRLVDYFVAELHYFTHTPKQVDRVRELIDNTLKSFEETHVCWRDHVYFYAVKK